MLLGAGERPVTGWPTSWGSLSRGRPSTCGCSGRSDWYATAKQASNGCTASTPRGLRPVHEWAGGFEQFWNESFDRLDEYVQDLEKAGRRISR